MLGDYLAVVKAEGIGPDDIFRVIDRIAGSRLPKDVFDAFFAQLEPASQVSEDQERSAREVKVARQALVNECCRKSVGDYSIASYLPEGWPAPDTDWSVTAYMRQLKGAEIGSDEVIAFIADKIGLADHAVEVAELYETLEPIVPEPVAPPVAASSTPPTALAPAEPPGRSLSYKPLGTSESKPMSEIEKAIEMLMVNSAMKEDSEWLFQFLAERTDVLSDLSAFMAKRMAEKLAPMVATDEQIAALDRRMGEYIRRFIVSPQATEGESST